MKLRKKIAFTYVILSFFSTLLLCVIVVILFRQNNQYYFIKRLKDRAKIVASIHDQNDPQKAAYYRNLKTNGLEELIDEDDFVLPVHENGTFQYDPKLHLPPEFYKEILATDSSWVETETSRYYYGQQFESAQSKYIVVITARDRRGDTTTQYIIRIFIIGCILFIGLAYFLGRFFAGRVLNPMARITKEANRITASNLHKRLEETSDEDEVAGLTRTFNDMLDRLETSFEIQANFINNASHELKTPITTIIAESEIMLLKPRSIAEYEESLHNIHSQAARLGNLTESLLKLTQTGYDGNKQVLDVSRMDELLETVKDHLDKIYPENKISLRLDHLPENEELLLLPCNRPLLELALANIISNGVKYSDNEVVFVELTADATTIKIRITDIGIGIPAEDLPHLYEPFFRGKKAAKYTGYGLGLPLASKIIRMHGGELQIQSEQEKGTMAQIVFTRKQIRNSNVVS
ncbi:HAMP domain-containing sensor histidine kinase [Flavobacterium silvaticum]|uniref:histidine kinase n=1 Tax=Flavobacterium silvaticum TaxID=1852020 RepID=A0A972FLJ4_9FLAO|nr:HAMP domain-containing sensor histidine kinase [Flavobacterium silvaticum]NMH27460.1 HAMP domain-containing histidine kinase [Flavobacterium silvaticum]